MYYYGGYQGGYGNSCGCGGNTSYAYPMYGYGQSYGNNSAIILVLFILLVIIIGSRSFN